MPRHTFDVADGAEQVPEVLKYPSEGESTDRHPSLSGDRRDRILTFCRPVRVTFDSSRAGRVPDPGLPP